MDTRRLKDLFIKPLVSANLNRAMSQAMEKNKDVFEDAQLVQFDSGKNADGRSRGTYRPFTKLKKRMKGQPTDRVTLKDTGSFYNKTKAVRRGKSIELKSTDSKTDEIIDKYGEKVFGLDEQTMSLLVIPRIKPTFVQQVKNQLKPRR